MTPPKKYIHNSLGRIQAIVFGMCLGSNYKGLRCGMLHYDDGEIGRQDIEKEVRRLAKYLTSKKNK